MPVTASSFRVDFPEFRSDITYPDSGINFWLNLGNQLLNQRRWGQPSFYQLTGIQPTPGQFGNDYKINDQIVLAGGSFISGAVVGVSNVGPGGALVYNGLTILGPGNYSSVPPNPVLQASTTGEGSGATFAGTFTSQPNTQYDVGLEMFVAHNLVLEARAQREANAGAPPGVTTGPVASKSVGGVNVSYDVGAGIIPGDGHWNLSIYGTRFMAMVNLYGAGPITVHGRGRPIGPWNGGAWPGPPIDRGYGPSGS